jgi:NNP family nitrate/nitrite transporter-like MFS transporter
MTAVPNTCPEPMSVRDRLAPILFLTGIFFLSFVSRVIFSPLMPTIEDQMGITHGEAGSLFLLLSMGFFVSMTCSGLVSSRITHRHTILLSSGLLGVALILFSIEGGLAVLRMNMVLLGVAAGFYTPSGVAVISALVSRQDTGKAMGIHNAAPNLSYVLAPLLCHAFMGWIHWRTLLVLLGLVAVAAFVFFSLFQKEGSFHGEPPNPAALANLGRRPHFWITILLFSIALAGSVGIYAVLPLYLVKERGLALDLANTLLSLSRISGLFMVFLSGWLTDKVGERWTINAVLLFTGAATCLLAVVREGALIIMVFLQPAIVAAFFPAGFKALSKIVPPRSRSLATAWVIPFGFLFGAGVVPAFIGQMAAFRSFSAGILITGILIACGSFFALLLAFEEFEEEGC